MSDPRSVHGAVIGYKIIFGKAANGRERGPGGLSLPSAGKKIGVGSLVEDFSETGDLRTTKRTAFGRLFPSIGGAVRSSSEVKVRKRL
jgi:hypothetical protein